MTEPLSFSVGICASDSAATLPSLLSFLREEEFGEEAAMQRLIVVASGCPPPILSELEREALNDGRIHLVLESERRGKAEAVNEVIRRASGDFLLLLNADALPARGAIRRLLRELAADPLAGCVSARPVFKEEGGLLARVLGLMWSAHNLASLTLNHANISNHSSDELLAVRRSTLEPLPANVVNDGAYIGGRIRKSGLRVRFSQAAVVSIAVPRRPSELVNQRRRIIFGHIQVWADLGSPPKTVESLLFTKPVMGMSILVSTLANRPRLLPAIPLAFVSEVLASFLALFDSARSTTKHVVWKRYEA